MRITCTKCDREPFNTVSSLRSHLYAAHGESCHCSGCKKPYKAYRYLNRHLKRGCPSICDSGTTDGFDWQFGKLCGVMGCKIRKASWEHMMSHWKNEHPLHRNLKYESKPVKVDGKLGKGKSKIEKRLDSKSRSIPSGLGRQRMHRRDKYSYKLNEAGIVQDNQNDDELSTRLKQLSLTNSYKPAASVFFSVSSKLIIN